MVFLSVLTHKCVVMRFSVSKSSASFCMLFFPSLAATHIFYDGLQRKIHCIRLNMMTPLVHCHLVFTQSIAVFACAVSGKGFAKCCKCFYFRFGHFKTQVSEILPFSMVSGIRSDGSCKNNCCTESFQEHSGLHHCGRMRFGTIRNFRLHFHWWYQLYSTHIFVHFHWEKIPNATFFWCLLLWGLTKTAQYFHGLKEDVESITESSQRCCVSSHTD